MQADMEQRAQLIKRQKANVDAARNVQQLFNPDGLKLADWKAQLTNKLARLDDLNKSHPELEQVCCLHCSNCKSGAQNLRAPILPTPAQI